jgi:hypothetical protein
MAYSIVEMLRKNYDDHHGVFNIRPVVDSLLQEFRPFSEVSASFREAEAKWRLPILEAMRVLATIGRCTEKEANDVLSATDDVVNEFGTDEYFKTVNALVGSPKAAPALTGFALRLLRTRGDGFPRRLAFYIVGVLLEHHTATLSNQLRQELADAAGIEASEQLREQFREVLAKSR